MQHSPSGDNAKWMSCAPVKAKVTKKASQSVCHFIDTQFMDSDVIHTRTSKTDIRKQKQEHSGGNGKQ